MNNYFGIGLDAKIALDFDRLRKENPARCRNRLKNIMWYVLTESIYDWSLWSSCWSLVLLIAYYRSRLVLFFPRFFSCAAYVGYCSGARETPTALVVGMLGTESWQQRR